MTVRLINPHNVSFAGESLPGCCEARVLVRPTRVRRGRDDGKRFDSHVEVNAPIYVIEIDCLDVLAATGVTPGQSGALSFTVDEADGSGSISVSAANAVMIGQRTRFRNQADGLSVTTLRFECRSASGSSAPVSIS